MEGVTAAEANKAIMSAKEAKLHPEKSRFAQGGFTEEFLEEMKRRREMEQEFGIDFTGDFVADPTILHSEGVLKYSEEEALEEQQQGTQYLPQTITPLVPTILNISEHNVEERETEAPKTEWGDVVSEGEEEKTQSDDGSSEDNEDEEKMRNRLLQELRLKRSESLMLSSQKPDSGTLPVSVTTKEQNKGKLPLIQPEPEQRTFSSSENMLNICSQSWEDLELRMISVGITLGSNEHSALKRKMEVMRELSLRDVIMFLEGYRACSHINEAKLSTQIDDLTKTVEIYRSHARNMDRMLSEMKGQEKAYFDLLENLTSTTQARIDAEKKATKEMLMRATTEKKEENTREERRRAREEKIRKEAEEMLKQELRQEIAYKEARSYSTLSKAPKAEKLLKDAQKSQINRESFSETGSEEADSDEPCLALIIICLHFSISPNELVREYGRTMKQLNHACRGMPKTEELMIKKYLNINEALNHFHRTVIRDKNT